jgi:hypothetical protein
MRRIELSERKKIRGIPRRLRALSKWAENFAGYYWLPTEVGEQYCNWKIPVISNLVNPPHTTKEIQKECMLRLLRAAELLAASHPSSYDGYYKVACLFTLPWLHQSEVTIFYDPDYYHRFYGEKNELAPRKLSTEFGFFVPNGFVERGFPITDEENGIEEEWWVIGQPI